MQLITGLLDLLLHLDKHLDELAGHLGGWTYLVLFLIVFAESGIILTPFLPGDALLFALGALTATTTHFNLFLILVLLTIAALSGYFFNYWVGATIGKTLFKDPNSKIFRRKYLDQTHAFYERYGAKTILFARYLPIIRTFAPFVAGMAAMNFLKFVLYTVIGGGVLVLGGGFGRPLFWPAPLRPTQFFDRDPGHYRCLADSYRDRNPARIFRASEGRG